MCNIVNFDELSKQEPRLFSYPADHIGDLEDIKDHASENDLVNKASLAEVLDFCNKINHLIGEDIQKELSPAYPRQADSCLLSLNIGKRKIMISPVSPRSIIWGKDKIKKLGYLEGELVWYVDFNYHEGEKDSLKISKELGLPILEHNFRSVVLPAKIGRVVAAYDAALVNPRAFPEFSNLII